ncbi:hypothetical protein DIPPA_08703 [Diplonema papillatum]|nr:hypothetical protein DIPPA_08703 [Diplonema papillatum]
MHSTKSFVFQTVVSCLYMMLEYMEIINIYNCERYWCGRTACITLGIVGLNAIIYRENFDLSTPLIFAHTLGAIPFIIWDLEYMTIFDTLIRTEYYDTHAMAFSLVFITNQLMIYRYLDKRNEHQFHISRIESVLSQEAERNMRLQLQQGESCWLAAQPNLIFSPKFQKPILDGWNTSGPLAVVE